MLLSTHSLCGALRRPQYKARYRVKPYVVTSVLAGLAVYSLVQAQAEPVPASLVDASATGRTLKHVTSFDVSAGNAGRNHGGG